MNLKSLVHRELGEGLTEKELASLVEVPVRTINNILADKLPTDPVIWGKFARYFHMNAEFLRTGGLAYSETVIELPSCPYHSPAGHVQEIPLLNWDQIKQIVGSKGTPSAIRAEAMLEATDVTGKRTFAVKVRDDSMAPLFSEGEIIFVNPDLQCEPEHYVIAGGPDDRPGDARLRQLKEVGGQTILHPLNRRYEDLPVAKDQRIWGRVVRLRKNL